MSTSPNFCRPAAYELFRTQLPELHRTDALVAATVAVSQHAMLDAAAECVFAELDRLAAEVQSRVQSQAPTAVLANMHELLFEELGFRGDAINYYHPRNSYLPAVLESRRGIPITLSLVYKAVAERLGLDVNGLNCPGHFLAEVNADGDRMIIDPFRGGIMLTRNEARRYIEQILQRPVPAEAQVFPVAGHVAWLSRILRNLQNIFSMQQNVGDMKAMWELEQLLIDSSA